MLAKLRAWKAEKVAQATEYTERMVPIWDQRRRARAAEREVQRERNARTIRWLWMPACLLIAYQMGASSYPHLRDDLAIRSRLEETIPHVCGSPQGQAGAPDGYYALCHDHFVDQVHVNIEADLIAMLGVPAVFLLATLGIPWLIKRRREARARSGGGVIYR